MFKGDAAAALELPTVPLSPALLLIQSIQVFADGDPSARLPVQTSDPDEMAVPSSE